MEGTDIVLDHVVPWQLLLWVEGPPKATETLIRVKKLIYEGFTEGHG